MNVGDTFRITRSINTDGKVSKRNESNKSVQKGTVVSVSTHVIVVDFGNYRESFQLKDLSNNKKLHTVIES